MSNIFSLFTDVAKKRVMNAQAAAQTTISVQSLGGAPVDVSDCDAFEIIVLVGSIAVSGVLAFKLQHGDEANGSDLTDMEGSALTALGASDDNKLLAIEVLHRNRKYVNPVLARSGGDVAIDGVIIQKYGMRGAQPVAQDATVHAAKQLGSPVDGTA